MDGPVVSHLLFADDTLLFSADKAQSIYTIRAILTCFELVSVLSINLTKSTTISIGDTTQDEAVQDSLGCTLEDLPFRYLGMPAGAPYICKKIWDPVAEIVEKILEGWKRGYLSYGGRLVLIMSVLSSLAVYMMSAFTIPPPVAKRIERAMRGFLWGVKDGRNRTGLVAWHKICHTKQEGGLGIKVLSVMNDALLRKWLWRFSNEPEALWRRIIEGKHGCDSNGWDAKKTKQPYGMGLWRVICNIIDKFKLGLEHKVGNGRKTRFWEDRWSGEEVLKDKYPNLFEVSRKKGVWVNEIVTMNVDGETNWNLDFKRRLTDMEISEAASLSYLL